MRHAIHVVEVDFEVYILERMHTERNLRAFAFCHCMAPLTVQAANIYNRTCSRSHTSSCKRLSDPNTTNKNRSAICAVNDGCNGLVPTMRSTKRNAGQQRKAPR